MERITDTHVFFWGGILSNWYPIKFKYKHFTFFNTEQAFMWEKAVYFGDMNIAEEIMKTPNPREAKKLGRKVINFNADTWTNISYQIMVDVNLAKFEQNRILSHVLLSTESKIIVEASPNDRIWGIGLHWSDDKCLDKSNWQGTNLLGKALMDVRKELINKYNED
jgi:hypothetical protein